MAHIRKLPSGNFNAVVRHPSGKRLSFTDPLKRVVKDWADAREREFRTGHVPAESAARITVAAWHERWTRSRRVEPATAAKDSSQIRTHVLPHWGTWPLQSIGRLDVQSWVKDMTHAGVGPSTVVGAYHRLAAMLSDAVLEGLLPGSPCREIDLPRIVKRPPRWLTKDEYGRIQLVLADAPRATVWQAMVGLGSYSGLRPIGELAGLDVEHLDFERNRVWVSQVMTRSGLRPYPKNDASVRSVPFPEEVGAMLWRIVGDRGSGPVFTSPTGGRVNESNFRNRVWGPALRAAGVGYESPYVMRHTAASWWIQAGLPDYRVARLLGHSSTRMVSVYAHLDPRRDDDVRATWASPALDEPLQRLPNHR